jgi:membrane fusion protein, multidrug efflux system
VARYRIVILAVIVLVVSTAACSRSPKRAEPRQQAVPVTVTAVQQKPVPVELRAIGTVVPTESVTVRARIGGTLLEIRFKEGDDVTGSAVLFTIDPRPLEADLRQAEANLAKATAEQQNAEREAARYADLVRQGFVAQSQYDQLRTTALSLQATVRAARAAVENARVQLGYTTIRAPIGGRTGVVSVREGDLIQANTTALVVINKLRPIDVSFSLPERQLADVQRYRAQNTLHVTVAAPGSGQPLGEGQLTFIDNRVDPATGTIQLKATFRNDPVVLWPGQFTNVVLTLATEPGIVVPTQAVQAGQEGRFVFVLKPDSTVESRPITVAREAGGDTVVTKGVTPGETVVTEGQLRLFPGAKVETRTAAASPPAGAEGAASPRTAPR